MKRTPETPPAPGSPRPHPDGAAHTPTPWKVCGPAGYIYAEKPYVDHDMLVAQIRGWGHLTGTGGGCAFSEEKAAAIQDANAAFIVRACNSHAELLAALKAIEAHHVALDERVGRAPTLSETLRIARAAIAHAEGRS